MIASVLRWAVLLTMLSQLVQALLRVPLHAELIGRLWGQPLSERGGLSADECKTFLGQSGHVLLRRRLRKTPCDRPSAVSDVWRWAQALDEVVAPHARVYVNTPHLAAFFYASFFWHPARVEADTGGRPVTDYDSLKTPLRVVAPSEFPSLAQRGYTHVLTQSPSGGIVLLELLPPSAVGDAR